MTTFAHRPVEEVQQGKLTFYKLVIEGTCLYDVFCETFERDRIYQKKLNKIRTYMNWV